MVTTSAVYFIYPTHHMANRIVIHTKSGILRVCVVFKWATIQQSNFGKQSSTDERHHQHLVDFNSDIKVKLETLLLHQFLHLHNTVATSSREQSVPSNWSCPSQSVANNKQFTHSAMVKEPLISHRTDTTKGVNCCHIETRTSLSQTNRVSAGHTIRWWHL